MKLTIFALIAVLFVSCSTKDNVLPVDTVEPTITSLTSNKTEIMYGGNDFAELHCEASGGSLKYVWQVDLGDIIPVTSNKSKVKFKASACCVGNKVIKCIVSNDKGSVTQSIVVRILEEQKVPEIISIQTSKSQLKADIEDSANLVCNALGGNLRYKWETDCGDLVFQSSDSSKVKYIAKNPCIGEQIVKCTVTNQLGTIAKTIKLNISK